MTYIRKNHFTCDLCKPNVPKTISCLLGERIQIVHLLFICMWSIKRGPKNIHLSFKALFTCVDKVTIFIIVTFEIFMHLMSHANNTIRMHSTHFSQMMTCEYVGIDPKSRIHHFQIRWSECICASKFKLEIRWSKCICASKFKLEIEW